MKRCDTFVFFAGSKHHRIPHMALILRPVSSTAFTYNTLAFCGIPFIVATPPSRTITERVCDIRMIEEDTDSHMIPQLDRIFAQKEILEDPTPFVLRELSEASKLKW